MFLWFKDMFVMYVLLHRGRQVITKEHLIMRNGFSLWHKSVTLRGKIFFHKWYIESYQTNITNKKPLVLDSLFCCYIQVKLGPSEQCRRLIKLASWTFSTQHEMEFSLSLASTYRKKQFHTRLNPSPGSVV